MEYYIIEYLDKYNELMHERIKADNAIEALSKFYAYAYAHNDNLGIKCISKADTVEEAIDIFEKFDGIYHWHIANIYTMGNWIYCTEVEDEEDNL